MTTVSAPPSRHMSSRKLPVVSRRSVGWRAGPEAEPVGEGVAVLRAHHAG